MEDEIKQTLFTTNEPTQIFLMERLRDWLIDTRINITKQEIEKLIDDYNIKAYDDFFQQHKDDKFLKYSFL